MYVAGCGSSSHVHVDIGTGLGLTGCRRALGGEDRREFLRWGHPSRLGFGSRTSPPVDRLALVRLLLPSDWPGMDASLHCLGSEPVG